MSDQDRIDRLERRVASLEQLMRRVMAGDVEASTERPEPPSAPPAPASPPPLATPEPPPLGRPAQPRPAPRPAIDGEQWVGQRGLLAVGVVAVVLAAGYLLKLSFDRGWISPLFRCIGGGVTGFAIAILGWQVDRRGYRSYGASLVGTGAAIIYVTIWAASRLYGFVPPMAGIVTMAVVALLLAGQAWLMDAEPLAAVAAVGAFLAPLVIGSDSANANSLLAYLAAIGFALWLVTWSKEWRLTSFLICLSYFGLGVWAAEDASPMAALVYGALGGAAGLGLGLRFGWWETRFLAFWGGWACLAIADTPEIAPLVLLAGAALSYPVWRYALVEDGTWPFQKPQGGLRPLLQSIYFYLTPPWLVWAVDQLGYDLFGRHEGLTVAIVAAAYLGVGVTGNRRPFAVAATIGVFLATLLEWRDTVIAPGVLGVVALAWGGIGRSTRRMDWNYLAFLPVAGGVMLLWSGMMTLRPEDAPAFIDNWALVCWGFIAVLVALATDLAAPENDSSMRRGALWSLAGSILFLAVTAELTRYFRLNVDDPAAAELAGGLAVSVWWLLFSGACILGGFRGGFRPLRIAGLWVSGIAVLKVVFVDLSTLDALYRVASVFGLGIVSLLVAWVYHRKAREEEGTEGDRLQR